MGSSPEVSSGRSSEALTLLSYLGFFFFLNKVQVKQLDLYLVCVHTKGQAGQAAAFA